MELNWKKILWIVLVLILVLMLFSKFSGNGVLFSPGESYTYYFWIIIEVLAFCLLVLFGLIIKSEIKKKEINESVSNKLD